MKAKKVKRFIISIILLLVLLFTTAAIPTERNYGTIYNDIESLLYHELCYTTAYEQSINYAMQAANFEEYDFCYYSVLVVKKHSYSMSYEKREASIEFREHLPEDFPEVFFVKSVECITPRCGTG